MTQIFSHNRRPLLLIAAILLLGGIGVVATEVYSAAITVTSQPIQNATSDGSIKYEAVWSAVTAMTRHESSDLTINVSDQVTTVTVQGTKTGGGVDVTVDLLDSSATVVDTATVSLPSAAGSYSTAAALTVGTTGYVTVARVRATYAAAADVEIDAISSGTTGPTQSGWSWTHTTGTGNNRLLIVGISTGEPVGSVSGVTYGGTPMTFLRRDLRTEEISSELWYLVNPASGTNVTIQVSISVDELVSNVFGAVTFNNVDQTTPVSGHVGTTGTGSTKSVTVTSAAGHMVMDNLAIFETSPGAVGAGQTAHWSLLEQSEGKGGGAASTEPGAASVTMSWSGSGAFALSATNIKKSP